MAADVQKLIDRSVELLKAVTKIEERREKDGVSLFQVNDIASRAANLIHSTTGARSVYADNLRSAMKVKSTVGQYFAVAGVLQAFHLDLSNGYLINIRHEVETEVVSEILSQAKKLGRSKGVHPAAVVIVAGAAVEEFLRNWCAEKGISIPEKQRSIGRFAQDLRTAGHIALPVERRVQSWADYRNEAAHGSGWNKITPEIADRMLHEIEEFLVENRQVLG